ncbi:MAG: hypothetical protein ABSF26_05135 [Thermoguttaceae bacterium]
MAATSAAAEATSSAKPAAAEGGCPAAAWQQSGPSPGPGGDQQLWIIDTRGAPSCSDGETGLPQIAYWQFDPCGACQWSASDAGAFSRGGAPLGPTIFLMHGYNTEPDQAVQYGWSLFARLQQWAGPRPFRLVVWSWPSRRTVRPLRADIQLKASASDTEGYYLARTIAGLKPAFADLPSNAHLTRTIAGLKGGSPVSLVGYSYGARIAAASLQLLAGGPVAGRRLPPAVLAAWSGGTPPIRAALLGAAIDSDSLEPGQPFGLSPAVAQGILVSQDSLDRVLRLYRRVYCRHGPQALGSTGPAGGDSGKLEVVNVTCFVRKRHDWRRYEAALPVVERLPWYTFLACEAGQ